MPIRHQASRLEGISVEADRGELLCQVSCPHPDLPSLSYEAKP